MENRTIYLWVLLGTILLGIAIYLGGRNKVDPEWIALDAQLDADYLTLEEARDSVAALFERVHGHAPAGNEIDARIGERFIPDVQYSKFRYYAEEILENRFAVFSSINGSGASTLTDRLARFVATDEGHILKIFGALNFDLDFHRKYIGTEKDGRFERGMLFDFFDRCLQHPDENFVLVFNDIHKIEPETFFGPDFWYKLYAPDKDITLHGQPIVIPPNFYMISVSHVKPNAKVVLTDEHYRRIGKMYSVEPNAVELIFYLRNELKGSDIPLSENPQIKRFVYAFKKANDIVAEKFNQRYRVGQWSAVRRLYDRNDLDELLDYFVYHVNSFAPRKEMTRKDLAPIEYAVRNEGRMIGSNFFSTQYQNLEEKGFLTEFIVGLSFILVSTLFSVFIFKRREKLVTKYITAVEKSFREFENREKGYDAIARDIEKTKMEVDRMALKKKIKYEEATFFYQYFYDKSRKIESAREAHRHFEDLMEVSLKDGKLTDNEYEKLLRFLEKIKTRIGESDYLYFKGQIDRMHAKYGQEVRK